MPETAHLLLAAQPPRICRCQQAQVEGAARAGGCQGRKEKLILFSRPLFILSSRAIVGGETKLMHFHLLSFEGPDAYSRAGGLATRIAGLAETLVLRGHETHLWYVGDPFDAGHEDRDGLKLHRWCQWVSRHHPGGVYDGEEGKRIEFAHSLPPFLVESSIRSAAARNERTVVLAEEWHSVDAVLHLDWLLRQIGLRDCVDILWNANNVFGFDRIDWHRLESAATITTVSRYMKHRMQDFGVKAVVIPNGLGSEAFLDPDRGAVRHLRGRFADRMVLSKVARFDPDKQWFLAIEIVAPLKQRGFRPLLIARGGVEAHGDDVMRAAAVRGLCVEERRLQEGGARGFVAAIANPGEADVVNLRSHLDVEMRRCFSALRTPFSRIVLMSRLGLLGSRQWRRADSPARGIRARTT